MVRRVTYEALVAVARAVADGHPEDERGLRAALDRPFAGNVEVEYFPSLWEKAAALLHGISTTQYFSDGNKRTAWLAAKSFLELNDLRLGPVPTVHAESFVYAVADKHLDVPRVAEWFRATWESQANDLFDPRLEFLLLATQAQLEESGSTISMMNAGVAGAWWTPDMQAGVVPVAVCGRLLWGQDDDGVQHVVFAQLLDEEGRPVPGASLVGKTMDVVPSGHAHHRKQRMPTLFVFTLEPVIAGPGFFRIELRIDGALAGKKTYIVHASPNAPEYYDSPE